ncbi:hypothetical protein CVIRNUC_000814 [Coccomyxa viridis]|uniref:glycerophosphodiester phosphodiesterase n=1 Tax=Coccomyxa viridis TaxID=1274662 RepID=A0AAV1HS49_9CHLO|nr:hypothetical protein CVIRNUC_000814 [Coccomyxa viridis]
MGENLVATQDGGRPLMHFRENTILSFNRAADAGASFMEFDVQVTADGRPVIWHDDLVLSLPSGADGPPRMHRISELTLRDFKKLSQHSCSSRLEASESSASTRSAVATGAQIGSCAGEAGSQSAQLTEPAALQARLQQSMAQKQSSAAAEAATGGGSSKVGARLLRTFNSDKGKRMHTAQAWSVSEEDTLPTLAEVFEGVDDSVGFDIEVKMATPVELVVTPPQEVERMVGPILKAVEALGTYGSRQIVFSSFDPEICRALRQRQQRHPVLFLSTGGTCWHADARRMSIAAAIRWALDSNLQGLVLDSGAVQEQSQAVATARSKGLKVLTYGLQNNDPAWVRHQYTLGVQGAIVDDVEGVVSAFGRAAVHAAQAHRSAELAA